MSSARLRSSPATLESSTLAKLQPILPTKYIPHKPTPKQALFLVLDRFGISEALFGGAAGPGKSDALLMAALQYVEVPGYASLILRRSYRQLEEPSALISRSHEWLGGTGARWRDRPKTWEFPSGATLTFGFLAHEDDVHNFDGSEFQCVCYDELTQFSLWQYRYVAFSRVRRLAGSSVPLRRLSASNPVGRGYKWVKQRFVDPETRGKGRVFIPARIEDNPHLDRETYIRDLKEQDPITRQQLLEGIWTARAGGGKFKREWFGEAVDAAPRGVSVVSIRRWDLASTAVESPEAGGGDWTVGCRMTRDDLTGIYYVEDVVRVRESPRGVEQVVARTSRLDGPDVLVRMEQEPGASGKAMIDHYRREVVSDRDFAGVPSTGSKLIRAGPLSGHVEAGHVRIVRGAWNEEFIDELEGFGAGGEYDDQVDAVSGAYLDLQQHPFGIQPILSDVDKGIIEAAEIDSEDGAGGVWGREW